MRGHLYAPLLVALVLLGLPIVTATAQGPRRPSTPMQTANRAFMEGRFDDVDMLAANLDAGDPDVVALKARAAQVFAARERGEPTVPTTIGLEKATNPFLRAPRLAARVGAAGEPDYRAFAAVRAAKDVFKG